MKQNNETGITTKTFSERTFWCSYYNETDDYLKNTRLLFDKILKQYSEDPSVNFLKLFSDNFNNRAHTGIRNVYSSDTTTYKDLCVLCALNINNFINEMKPKNFMDTYNYRHKIKGSIHCVARKHNVIFSYKDHGDSIKDLDFACLNSYIYNQTHNLDNACLVFSVPTNVYYIVKYDKNDYTMGRGFLTHTRRTKLRRRGDHCARCNNTCRHTFLNGLDRLGAKL